jgi:hypothetical protein
MSKSPLGTLRFSRQQLRWWTGLCVVSLVSGGIGYGISDYRHTAAQLSAPGSALSERHLGRLNFTNPLVDTGPTGGTSKALSDLRRSAARSIEQLERADPAVHIAVYYQDLGSNDWFGIAETESFMPASLMKVLLMMNYYKLAEYNPGVLLATVEYQGQYAELANLPPAQRLALDAPYTIDELIEHMIVHSDNEATRILAGYLSEHIPPKTNERVMNDISQLVPFSLDLEDEFLVSARDWV